MVTWNLNDILKLVPGLKVVAVDGWYNRSAGSLAPAGIVVHHTAGGYNTASNLSLVVNGRSDVRGPLANIFIARDGTVYVVANTRANHAGYGNKYVLDLVRQGKEVPGDARSSGNMVGNPYFFGIEVDNNGRGEPYPDTQLEALFKTCAAISNYFKWNQNHTVHHREWTSRKIDMSYHGNVRGAVGLWQLKLSGWTPPVEGIPDTSKGKGVYDMANIGTAAVSCTHKGFGLCEGAVNATQILGKPPTAIIGAVPQGPYPDADGWWTESINLDVRAQIRGDHVIVTCAGLQGSWQSVLVYVSFA